MRSARVTFICTLLAACASAQEYKDVARIFTENCEGCHSPSAAMSGFNLATYEALMKGGKHGLVVVPGKPQESRLFQMISGVVKPAMPMGGQTLAAGDIEAIRNWIQSGAKNDGTAAVAGPSAAAPGLKPTGPVKQQIYSLAMMPGGNSFALGGYREVRFHPESEPLKGAADAVRSVAISPDGKLLAAAGGLPAKAGEVQIWSLQDHKLVRTIKGHSDCIYAVVFSPDGKQIATSSYDKLIKIWDVATGNEARTLKDHIDAVYALAWTPDGGRIISGAADRTVKIWEVQTGTRLYTLGEPADGINTVAIDPTGKLVAAAGIDKSIRIWSLGAKEGKLLEAQIAHEDAILRLAWSPDGKVLASAAADRTIKLFSVPELKELRTMPSQPDWIYGLAFSPDGHKLIAARLDGSVAEYPVNESHLQTATKR